MNDIKIILLLCTVVFVFLASMMIGSAVLAKYFSSMKLLVCGGILFLVGVMLMIASFAAQKREFKEQDATRELKNP